MGLIGKSAILPLIKYFEKEKKYSEHIQIEHKFEEILFKIGQPAIDSLICTLGWDNKRVRLKAASVMSGLLCRTQSRMIELLKKHLQWYDNHS